MKRLLTIGHSYVVAANRALAHHLAREGRGEWTVTALAPARFRGDLRSIDLEPIADEAATLRTAPVHLDRVPHLMWYGGETRALMAGEWDVIHCWEEPYVLAAANIAGAARDRARFVPATFQNISKRYPWPLSAFERKTMNRAAGWIAFGETARGALQARRGYDHRPNRVIPPGVDVDNFRPDVASGEAARRRLGWKPDALVVGFLGRFVEQKGIAILIEALRHSSSDWHALFVGGGPLESVLAAFARQFPGRVHVQTGVTHHDVPTWLHAMTMLCAPSQTTEEWREQFGRMLIEAMACGVPVIASDSGEMPFVVGDAGIVVSERDIAAWTASIDRLLADSSVRRDLAARGSARVRDRFAWPVVARAHLDFFEALIGGAA